MYTHSFFIIFVIKTFSGLMTSQYHFEESNIYIIRYSTKLQIYNKITFFRYGLRFKTDFISDRLTDGYLRNIGY